MLRTNWIENDSFPQNSGNGMLEITCEKRNLRNFYTCTPYLYNTLYVPVSVKKVLFDIMFYTTLLK